MLLGDVRKAPLAFAALPHVSIAPAAKHWNSSRTGAFTDASVLMEDNMRSTLALLTILVASPAFADFYVVQEPTTKKCKVVETVPTDKTWVQIGPLSFKTRDEADKQVTRHLQRKTRLVASGCGQSASKLMHRWRQRKLRDDDG